MALVNCHRVYSFIIQYDDHCHFLGLVWFHLMESNGIEGGNTILVDGFKLAEQIKKENPEHYMLLSNVSIPYQMTYKDEATYNKRRVTFTHDEDGQLNVVYLNNTDRRPLDAITLSEAREVLSCDANEAVRKMYEAMRHLHQLLLSDQYGYKFPLQPGKMLLMHNYRVLHGRDEVVAGVRTLHGTWTGESEWLSKMKMLERKLM